MKTLLRDSFLLMFFLLILWYGVDQGLGFYRETQNPVYFISIGEIKDIFLYGGVAASALVSSMILLFFVLTDIDKIFRLSLRLRIIQRKRRSSTKRTPAN